MTSRAHVLLISLAALLVAVPSQAGVGHISVAFDGSPADIIVYSDGNRFTHITQSTLDFVVGQDIDCGSGEKVRYAVLAAGAGAISTRGGALGAEPRAWMETHPGAKRAVRFPVDLADYFRTPAGSPNPVQICNRALDQRVAQGQLRHALLQQGFTVPVPYVVSLAANCTRKNDLVEGLFGTWPGGGGWKHATDQTIGVIRCKAKSPTLVTPTLPPPTGPNDLAVPFQIQSVRLEAQPAVQTAVCPATVRFEAAFEAVGKGTVRYRGNVNGGLGPVKTLRFERSGTKRVPLQIQVGAASPPVPSSGGGDGIAHGGGFAPAPQGPPGPPEAIEGWVRVEIVAPEAGVDRSKKERYTVRCRDVPNLLSPTEPTKPDDTKPGADKPGTDRQGRGAQARKPADTMVVQELLNPFSKSALPVPAAVAGQLGLPPGRYELDVDGLVGAKTLAATLRRNGRAFASLAGRPAGCSAEVLLAIEVKELVIKAVVNPPGSRAPSAGLSFDVHPRSGGSGCRIRMSSVPAEAG